MKYSVAALLATTNALHIRAQAPAAATCSSNFERLTEQKAYTLTSSFVTSNIKDGQFEDPSFPADDTSLYNEMQASSRNNRGQVRNYMSVAAYPGIKWKRPTDLSKDVSLWGSEGINPKISEQGFDGDCWFLSAASALAAYPERVKAMFPGQDSYSKNGAFQVRLFVRGEPVNVVVDDRMPVYNYSAAEGYSVNYPWLNDSPSKAGAYWLMILEKAMAKLNVNYTGINGGQIGQAMRYMTGMPTNTYHSNTISDAQLWTLVEDGLSKDYNMGAACQVSHFNMISGHAYGTIGAVTLKGGANDGQQLIQMRNPWGSNKYNGPWSEKSKLWTADYRKQAKDYGTIDIGEFWIPLDQWRTDYTYLAVNNFNPDWKVESYEGTGFAWDTTWGQLNSWITVDNAATQDLIIECVQNEDRLFPTSDCETENSPDRFVFQFFDDKLDYIQGTSGSAECNGTALTLNNLPKGSYQTRVINMNGSNSGKKTLFKMKTFAATAAVKLTQNPNNNYIFKY